MIGSVNRWGTPRQKQFKQLQAHLFQNRCAFCKGPNAVVERVDPETLVEYYICKKCAKDPRRAKE
jgi:predicted SprT family Zn-dependent metalloprotease